MSLKIVPADWKQILRGNFTSWEKLSDFLQLDEYQRKSIIKKSSFPLNLPTRLANKIQKKTLKDPILKQFLPVAAENDVIEGYEADPVEDRQFRCSSKLLKKYEGRVLIVTTSACAMHCRYCFRQKFDYQVTEKGFDEELKMIAADPSIHEVILSGGDPLSLPNNTLKALIDGLDAIPHLTKLRFHTRFPIGIPERIDAELCEILQGTRLQTWFVIHCNHPDELDDDIFSRLKLLQKCGIPVLNQAVLLRDVNDDVETLKRLCLKLVDRGVFPYYLHQLDRVQGAAHFEVTRERGLELVAELTKLLPGYAVPKYVEEIPGQESKTPV